MMNEKRQNAYCSRNLLWRLFGLSLRYNKYFTRKLLLTLYFLNQLSIIHLLEIIYQYAKYCFYCKLWGIALCSLGPGNSTLFWWKLNKRERVNKPRNDKTLLELIERRWNSGSALQERPQTWASELENARFFMLMQS